MFWCCFYSFTNFTKINTSHTDLPSLVYSHSYWKSHKPETSGGPAFILKHFGGQQQDWNPLSVTLEQQKKTFHFLILFVLMEAAGAPGRCPVGLMEPEKTDVCLSLHLSRGAFRPETCIRNGRQAGKKQRHNLLIRLYRVQIRHL